MNEDLFNEGKTSNYQLIEIAKQARIPLKKVLFKDQLAGVKPVAGAYIINMQDSTSGEGSHWVGLVLEPARGKKYYAWYFDGYGVDPPEEVLSFSKKYGASNLFFSPYQVQAINTNFCGQYTMLWLYTMLKTKGTYEERYWRFLDGFRSIRKIS
jgi:hypothetical protein